MKRAVFLDRDGVINELIFNPNTGEYESPHVVEDFHIKPDVVEQLLKLQQKYLLFLVTNQPSYAKGKTSMENIKEIHAKLDNILLQSGVKFAEYFYCYHHPKGVIPEYTCICECRKPGVYFLEAARQRYGINMQQSWMVGDQDSDVLCGQNAGVKTILIREPHSSAKRGTSCPDYEVDDLCKAVEIILNK